ncbi:MAG: DegT/DnrJ/EryC1/StrS aminotransferase family protein [Euryarchaeota archaeon]|nr:DegT/DnrJ/EryC1/StrS aminotransferase family protein [Euryarchaeota archaeon]
MIPIAKPLIGSEEQRAVTQVLASGHLAAGDVVTNFEAEFAAYVGTAHAVAVANGTVAIQAALEALEIGPGDEVIVPAFTFIATANAVLYAGAKPVLVDIDPVTFTLAPDRLERARSTSTKAVIPVHLFGQPADMERIRSFASEHDLAVVGDAAQAHGAKTGGRMVGGLADCETWSFYPTKNMTCGEGGMVTTDDSELARRVRSIANHGRTEAALGVYDHLRRGNNWRLTNVHAAIGREQLRKLPGWVKRRREVAKRYDAAFSGLETLRPPGVNVGNYHAYHQYTLLCDDRDKVIETLKANEVGFGIYYPKPLHHYPHLEKFGHSRLENSVRAAERVLSVPVHPGLSDEDVEKVVQAVVAADEASQG